MRRAWLVAMAIISVATVGLAGAGDFRSQELRVDGRVNLVLPTDVNGDGINDLVVSYAAGQQPNFTPRVAIFFASPLGPRLEPSLDFALPGDTCLFDLSDLDGDGVQEIIVMRKWEVVASPLDEGGKPEWKTLLERGPGVLFPPQSGAVSHMDFLRDWTGNGELELAVPDYGTLRFFRADKKGVFTAAFSVRLATKGWGRVSNPSSDQIAGDNIEAGINLPHLFVVSSERGNELIAIAGEEVWRYPAVDGKFREKGERRLFSVLTDQERRADNMSVLGQAADFNGDGYPDLLLNKIGGSLSGFNSAVVIYAGTASGFGSEPVFRFQREGFAAWMRFVDLDGDGLNEMYLPYGEFNVTQLVRMLVTKKVKMKAQIYRGESGFFAAEPAMVRGVTLEVDTSRGMELRGFPPEFSGDFDGDGLPDLMMAHGEGFGVYRNNGQLSFAGTPMKTHAIAAWGQTRLIDLTGDAKCDLVAWDSNSPERRGKIVVLVTN